MGQEPGRGCGWEQEPRRDSSIWAWIWHGTGTREGAGYWEGTGAWEGAGAWEAGGCKSLGMGGHFNRGKGWGQEPGREGALEEK